MPLTSVSPAAFPRPVNVNKLPTHPSKLLIADDEHLVASGLASNLEELGYTIVGPVSCGKDAIELCKVTAPDMALLDIRMSAMDGITAGEILFRKMGIPVVIFSAYSDTDYIDASNRVGVFGYLLKPVTQDQLRVGVSVAWGRYIDFMRQASQIDELKKRLEDRKTIEQAKWIIVKRRSISEPEAMKLLQRQARNNRRTLVDVCRAVLDSENIFGD